MMIETKKLDDGRGEVILMVHRGGRWIFQEWLDHQGTTMRYVWFKFLEEQISDVHGCSLDELPADQYAQEFVDMAYETFQQIMLDETTNPNRQNLFHYGAELN